MPVYELQDDTATLTEEPTPTKVEPTSRNSRQRERRPSSRAQDHVTNVLAGFQAELDGYFVELNHLGELDPADVLLKLSSMSARAGEIRSRLIRSENQRANAFRTREIDPFMEQLKFQFTVHSRLIAVRQQELDLLRGQG